MGTEVGTPSPVQYGGWLVGLEGRSPCHLTVVQIELFLVVDHMFRDALLGKCACLLAGHSLCQTLITDRLPRDGDEEKAVRRSDEAPTSGGIVDTRGAPRLCCFEL